MAINEKNIGNYINFLYRQRKKMDAPKNIIEAWVKLPNKEVSKNLQKLYAQWGLNDFAAEIFENTFLQQQKNKKRNLKVIAGVGLIVGFSTLFVLINHSSGSIDETKFSIHPPGTASKELSEGLPALKESDPESLNKHIKKIQEDYHRINSANLQNKKIPYSNECGIKNSTIDIYSQNGEILKITDNGFGDGENTPLKWSYEYYFRNGSLFFSFRWKRYFNSDLQTMQTQETREYFLENKLIKKIDGDKTTYPETTISSQDIRYLLQKAKSKDDIMTIFNCNL